MVFQKKEEPSQQEEKSTEISGLEWGGKKVQNAQQVCLLMKVFLLLSEKTLVHILILII